MIRVAFIAGTYKPSQCGIAHYTECLRTALNQYNVYTKVLTTYDAARAYHDSNVSGAVCSWSLLELILLAQAIQEMRANIVHIQYTGGRSGRFEHKDAILLLPLVLRIKRWTGRFVITVHEQYEQWESEWQLPFMPHWLTERLKSWGQHYGLWDREGGFLFPTSSAIVVSNFYHEVTIQTRLPRLRNRIYRVPIGTNIAIASLDGIDAKLALRQKYNWPNDSLVIVFFGFLNPRKDLEMLIEAFNGVLTVKPMARLLLVGGVENRLLDYMQAKVLWEKLHKSVAELGLAEYIHATGYLPHEEVSHHLSGADIGVLPFKDGTTLKSGSLMAFLAHGLPIVATSHNPPDPDLVNEPMIRLITHHDPDNLARNLLELLNSPEMRVKMSMASRLFFHKFTWPVIAQQHLEIYQHVLDS